MPGELTVLMFRAHFVSAPSLGAFEASPAEIRIEQAYVSRSRRTRCGHAILFGLLS